MTDECTGNECEYGGWCRGDAPCGGCCGCVGACLATADTVPSLITMIKELRHRLEGLEK